MKKQLLFTTSIFVSGLLCAQVARKSAQIPANLANISITKSAVNYDKLPANFPVQIPTQGVVASQAAKVALLTETIVGTTIYDLQSNASVGDRIVVNADGTIATCWTIEPTDASGTYANRGTGYNYYNGSTWGTSPTARIENARVGWGNVVNTRSGRELVISHGAGNATSNVASRNTKGTGTWVNNTVAPTNVSGGNWWPRMVSSSPRGGDTIYSVSISYPVANGGVLYNGLDGALLFSRSIDAGLTWDIENQIPTGLTAANFIGFGGDGYAITASGSTVAIVAGNSDSDIALVKSTDGGATWTAKTIQKFPLPLWDAAVSSSDIDGDGVADTIPTNDASYAIALDNSGMAYVAYGGFRILNDAPSAAGWSYFPYTDGLYLWNESMPANLGGNLVAGVEDLLGDNTIDFPAVTSPDLAFGRWQKSLTSYPSMAFDANNDLYLSYSSIVDGLRSVDPNKLVRHQYVVKSCVLTPGAEVFSIPMDIVPGSIGAAYEGVFGSMAKNIDGNVHIIYQRDFYAGNGIPSTSGTNPDADNLTSGGNNDMVYVKIPTSDFTCVTGINESKTSSLLSNINFYPNPASTSAMLDINLADAAKLDIAILNAVGQTVYSTSVAGRGGQNTVQLNLTNLSAGLYFYQVKAGNGKAVTKKFAVEK